MQTFLPYADFKLSAQVLDYRRLGKQRVECKQILNVLGNPLGAWYNHPITQMWKDYPEALRQYQREMILEWIKRGYKNTMDIPEASDYEVPFWLGNENIHSSHRSMLLKKDSEYYQQFGWNDSLEHYYWMIATDQQAYKHNLVIGSLYTI